MSASDLSDKIFFVELANFSRIGKKLNSLFPQLVFHCREQHEATESAPSRDWLSRLLVAEHLLRKLYLKKLWKNPKNNSKYFMRRSILLYSLADGWSESTAFLLLSSIWFLHLLLRKFWKTILRLEKNFAKWNVLFMTQV